MYSYLHGVIKRSSRYVAVYLFAWGDQAALGTRYVAVYLFAWGDQAALGIYVAVYHDW